MTTVSYDFNTFLRLLGVKEVEIDAFHQNCVDTFNMELLMLDYYYNDSLARMDDSYIAEIGRGRKASLLAQARSLLFRVIDSGNC